MELIFCFCRQCFRYLEGLHRKDGSFPAWLNAYSDARCANCGRKRKMAGTRKFSVELMNVEEKDGIHQYTEFAVIRYIEE